MDINNHHPYPLFFISHIERKSNWSMKELHYHHAYEIYFLEKGHHSMIIEDTLFDVDPQDVVLFPSNAIHKSHNTKEYTRTSVYFTHKFLDIYFTPKSKEQLLKCFNGYKYSFNKEDFKEIKKLLLLLEKENINDTNNKIFIYLVALLNILNNHKPTSLNTYNTTANKKLSAILAYISQNYNTITSIEQIANEFYITKYYLCRIFKESTGLTLMQYITNIKIQNACTMLKNTDMTITNIGEKCGFNSTMYFCKCFSRIMNMSPGQFRKS